MTMDERAKKNLTRAFEDIHGPMNEGWSLMLERAPDFFSAFVKLSSVPLKTDVLTPKMRELIRIAMAAATTHLFAPGLQAHIKRAKALGASLDEVLAVLQLSTGLGVHTMILGLPTLVDVMKEMGLGPPGGDTALTARQEEQKAEWIKQRGFWHPLMDDMQRLIPDFFEAFVDFSVAPVKTGQFTLKERELIYIAIDTSTTHLHAQGTRMHIANALRAGATPAEILDVLSIVSTQGGDTITLGAAIAAVEFDAEGH